MRLAVFPLERVSLEEHLTRLHESAPFEFPLALNWVFCGSLHTIHHTFFKHSVPVFLTGQQTWSDWRSLCKIVTAFLHIVFCTLFVFLHILSVFSIHSGHLVFPYFRFLWKPFLAFLKLLILIHSHIHWSFRSLFLELLLWLQLLVVWEFQLVY